MEERDSWEGSSDIHGPGETSSHGSSRDGETWTHTNNLSPGEGLREMEEGLSLSN